MAPAAFKAVVRRAERLGCVRFACISATETIRPRLFGRRHFSFGAVSHRRPRRRALLIIVSVVFVSHRWPHCRSLGIVVRFASTPPSEVFTFGQFFPECPSSDVENGKNCSIFSPSSRRMRIPHYFAELWTKRMSRTPQKKRISLKWQLTKPQSATQAAVGNASGSLQCKLQSAMQVAKPQSATQAVAGIASRSSITRSNTQLKTARKNRLADEVSA